MVEICRKWYAIEEGGNRLCVTSIMVLEKVMSW
jgi:hypothetical protein